LNRNVPVIRQQRRKKFTSRASPHDSPLLGRRAAVSCRRGRCSGVVHDVRVIAAQCIAKPRRCVRFDIHLVDRSESGD
jgi:hypothetical protein